MADIEAAYPTLKAIHRYDKAFAFVLNQAPVRGRRPAHVATGLHEVGALAFPYIALRNDHMDIACRRSRRIGIRAQRHCRCRNPRAVGLVQTQISERRVRRGSAPTWPAQLPRPDRIAGATLGPETPKVGGSANWQRSADFVLPVTL